MPENRILLEIVIVTKYGNKRINLVHGDITAEDVDAIVNAANTSLKHGGGVAAAIARAGGHIIQQESDKIGHVPTGDAAVTSGGSLKARYVIHTVGPIWGEGDEERKLRSAVRSALERASELNLNSISMPAVSGGIYGYPKEECATVILSGIAEYLKDVKTSLHSVNICLVNKDMIGIFSEKIRAYKN